MGYQPCHQLRFFRRGRGRFPCRAVHEKLEVDGRTGTLAAPLLHFPPGGLAKAVQKQNLYSEYHALARRRDGRRFSLARLLLSPPHMFLRRYLAESGWREGIPGVVLSVQSAYSVFLIHAKLWEREADKDADAAELLGASDPAMGDRTRGWSRRSDVPSVFSVEG